MDFSIDDSGSGTWAYPDIGVNLKQPVDQRAACLIVPLTGAERLAIDKGDLVKIRGRGKRERQDPLALFEERAWAKRMRVLKKCVRQVRGFFRVENGVRTEVKTIEDLLALVLASRKAMLVEALDEIYEACLDESKLEDMTRGESVEQSDSL